MSGWRPVAKLDLIFGPEIRFYPCGHHLKLEPGSDGPADCPTCTELDRRMARHDAEKREPLG